MAAIGGTRQKIIRHTACFTPLENAVLMTNVKLAAVPISTYLKCAALDYPLPRAARRPTMCHQDAVRLLDALGDCATAFRDAQGLVNDELAGSATTDLAELRLLCFDALGRAP